ncbi:MAG: suppressor of fused family protein, partial [Massilia sp.]|nr:suppressor of fused family protein [Massilia sp.]
IMPHIPMGIVDITRETFLRDGTIQTQVADGTLRDGCSTGVVADSSLSLLALRQRKFWLFFRHTEVLLSVAEFHEIQSIIPLRLPYGRTFEFSRAETVLLFEPAAKNAFSLSGSKLTIGLNADGLKCLTEDVPTSDGVHVFIHVFAALPLLRWFVHNYPLKNPDDTIATV